MITKEMIDEEMSLREQADEAMKPLWEIRKRIYEETKDLTPEERREYYRVRSESFEKLMEEVNPDDYDLSFLYEDNHKQKSEKTANNDY